MHDKVESGTTQNPRNTPHLVKQLYPIDPSPQNSQFLTLADWQNQNYTILSQDQDDLDKPIANAVTCYCGLSNGDKKMKVSRQKTNLKNLYPFSFLSRNNSVGSAVKCLVFPTVS
jgi:hypothetical protein